MEDTVTISSSLYHRMVKALIKVEEILSERQALNEDWVNEDVAVKLLGCSNRQLSRLKSNGSIRYKAVGRRHQYSRKSIDKYNELMST